jgi:molybdopterin converting factor small subunit
MIVAQEKGMPAKKVSIVYYAVLREERGKGTEAVETEAHTLAELYSELKAKHNFRLPVAQLQVAVDDEFGKWDAPVRDGSKIVFIPPVAGG